MCFQNKEGPSKLNHEGCFRPNCQYSFYDVSQICKGYSCLPYCKRILLECAFRKSLTTSDQRVSEDWKRTVDQLLQSCCKTNDMKEAAETLLEDSNAIANPEGYNSKTTPSIMFHPGRVVLQDFTGVAALVDLAALRDAVEAKVDDLSHVDCQCPADLVVDNFAQVKHQRYLQKEV